MALAFRAVFNPEYFVEEHPEALSIVQTLKKKGFEAFYAGGWVRDYLLQHPSDDIDIATDASPEMIQKLFEHTVPIGIAFGIILVIIGERQYEVATFRKDIDYVDGRRPTKVEFTSAEQDAMRRDFTVNGMFYDPIKKEVLDYVKGKEDLEKKIIKAIGDPHERIKEDRLRMIRAIRLGCRFHFTIEENTLKAICAHATELFPAVAIERIVQEMQKMAAFPNFKKALLSLHETGLLPTIFPDLRSISLKEIEDRLIAIEDFPKKTPIILYILELFGTITLDQKIQICKYLKLPNQQMQFITFHSHAEELLKREPEDIEWAYFYANPFSYVCLCVHAAHLKMENRQGFLTAHEERKSRLGFAIDRIEKHDPIVKSGFLKSHGIGESPLMGKLLKEAERIAVNEQLLKADEILEKLRETPLWPNT